MSKTRGFLLAAAVAAMAFTLSCDSGGGGGGGGGGYTGSYGSVEDADGKSYKTVQIGTQIWMAENLNYDPGTGNSACYDNKASNCATYGRLYDWSTAMGLASSCNESICSSQIQAEHKGVCPSGWHIPTDAEWTVLTDYVGGSNAGTKLKATSGWNSYYGVLSGNGTDDYGFSALPGGEGSSDGIFSSISSVGEFGYWWSATETARLGAYDRVMLYLGSNVLRVDDVKSRLFSVRCIQGGDDGGDGSSSSGGGGSSSSSFVPIDKGNNISSYRTVEIGDQRWMAENLNYTVPGSICYGNNQANCDEYGQLYDWATAMALPSSCNESNCSGQIQSKHRGICPSGWHIPTDAEWTVLTDYVGGSSTAGTKLKATSGWNYGNGTDDYDFSALPGGFGSSGGSFYYVGDGGVWWSASEYDSRSSNAYDRSMSYDSGGVNRNRDGKSFLQSVRCVQD